MEKLFAKIYSQFLQGKTNLKEFGELKNSLNQLSDHALSYFMKEAWKNISTLPAMEKSTKKRIKKNIHLSIKNHPNPITTIHFYRTVAAVAVVVLLLHAGWPFFSSYTSIDVKHPYTVEVPAGNKAEVRLPDNSIVKLNSASTLSYHYSADKKRVVKLNGEAFFSVQKNKTHPFIVQTGELNIEVIGTTFNVSSHRENDIIETALVTGSIKISPIGDTQTYILKPNHKAIYSKSKKTLSFIETNTKKETAWLQNTLFFESEPLISVLHKIERWYGVKIKLLCPEFANDLISGSFKNEQLTYVMEALRIQYGFLYKINESEIIINKLNKTDKPMK